MTISLKTIVQRAKEALWKTMIWLKLLRKIWRETKETIMWIDKDRISYYIIEPNSKISHWLMGLNKSMIISHSMFLSMIHQMIKKIWKKTRKFLKAMKNLQQKYRQLQSIIYWINYTTWRLMLILILISPWNFPEEISFNDPSNGVVKIKRNIKLISRNLWDMLISMVHKRFSRMHLNM